ncbi:hypothetical protein LTR27_003028 [Elasticomyces elasticus]|nr:hypothetical protein LTR27_003028 [Elasticomyces elasticus]
MQFFATALAAALSITTTYAAPRPLAAPTPHEYIAAEKGSNLVKREVGGVRVCTGIGFTGSCDYVVWPLNGPLQLEQSLRRPLQRLAGEQRLELTPVDREVGKLPLPEAAGRLKDCKEETRELNDESMF